MQSEGWHVPEERRAWLCDLATPFVPQGRATRSKMGTGAMTKTEKSPQILSIRWGEIQVQGCGTFRDAKLFPGGGREWDWNETGTHHVPGIQPADVLELLEHGSEVIVLSRGMRLALKTCPETLKMLEEMAVTAIVEETGAAAETYNRLVAEGKAVGGLFHSTC